MTLSTTSRDRQRVKECINDHGGEPRRPQGPSLRSVKAQSLGSCPFLSFRAKGRQHHSRVDYGSLYA
jgi:hypothetical protein